MTVIIIIAFVAAVIGVRLLSRTATNALFHPIEKAVRDRRNASEVERVRQQVEEERRNAGDQ